MSSKPMTVTLNDKTQLVVPSSVQRRAGLKAGDRLEFKVSGGIITITPQLPSADDEYTPEQRKIIDAQLDEAEKGPFHGPFDSADEMIAHMKAGLKKRATIKKSKRSR
jgi:AbrB family looped-hinge helix DNA binding protein